MTAPEPRSLYQMPSPVERLAAEIAELRPLPESALRIARLTTEDRFSAQELSGLIAQDPAITARLLRVANSAYYGFPRRIGTVRDAVVLVGLRAVRSVVLVACVMDTAVPAPARPSIDPRTSWRFAVAVGLIAELFARREGLDADAAFTAGVLHNIGLVALDQHRPEPMRAVIRKVSTGKHSLEAAERAVFGFTDADLGGAIAARWAFPPDLVAAIRDHGRSLDELPDRSTLSSCVLRARLVVHTHGLPDGARAQHDARADGAGIADAVPVSVSDEIVPTGVMTDIIRRADAFVEATVS